MPQLFQIVNLSSTLAQGLAAKNIGLFVCTGVAIVFLLMVLAALSGGQRCSVCETPIKKKSYRWKIDGKKQVLCPKCNSQMERRMSSSKFKDRFG
jgi:hypothetical protein